MHPTNLLALISVIGSLVSPVTWADLQMDETVDRSETWTIGYNNSLKGCVASAISADGTTVWVGFAGIESDVDVPAYLAFTNPNWRFIEPRKFYEVEVRTVGSRRRKGYASGIEQSNDRGIFVLGVKWQLIEELVRGSGLLFSVNKGQPTAINITGFGARQHRKGG